MVVVQDPRSDGGLQNQLRPAAIYWRHTQQSMARRAATAGDSSWEKGDAICAAGAARGGEKCGLL